MTQNASEPHSGGRSRSDREATMQADHRIARTLVREEIEHIVSRAARGRGFLRAGEHAYRIMKQYPNCGMSGEEVVNEIIAAAAASGVAVEMSRPHSVAA